LTVVIFYSAPQPPFSPLFGRWGQTSLHYNIPSEDSSYSLCGPFFHVAPLLRFTELVARGFPFFPWDFLDFPHYQSFFDPPVPFFSFGSPPRSRPGARLCVFFFSVIMIGLTFSWQASPYSDLFPLFSPHQRYVGGCPLSLPRFFFFVCD